MTPHLTSADDPSGRSVRGLGRPALATVVVHGGTPARVTVEGLADTSTGRAADASTPFHLCSTAKTVTAVVALRLARGGVLDLDADVRDVLDVEVVPVGPGPSVRQLLSHHGGVVDPPDAFTPAPAEAPSTADVVAGRTPHHDGPVRVTEPPGHAFSYSEGGFCLVERVVETVCDEPFAAVVHREVVAPLGLTATTAWAGERSAAGARSSTLARVAGTACAGHHRDGTRVDGVRVHYAGPSASGLWASPADVGVLLADLLRAWRGGGSVLLDPASAAAMLEDRYVDGVGLGVFVGGPRVMSQGWGLGFQAKLLADRDADRAVAVLLARDPGVPQQESVVGRTVRALMG
ncbi:serine hydrolase domain-containing protein [Cellulomonas septica]|uniref:Beta-lactamase family protein n=1 Tax=Cellulomonas septica TaxID=285080 RepID=A0ABX1K4Y2_9CELL|nr:serine hydrolase domain-containing protein [Cellulomonas septica]NKY40625.1 beta-lactamase family protein [Cellulomonas septica]